MSSLIFKRDFENPHFRKNDSIVSFQTHQLENSTPSPSTLFITNPISPKSQASKFKPLDISTPISPKTSLPYILTPNSSSYRKSRVDIVPISNLYTDRSHIQSRKKSDSLPLLSCRDYDSRVSIVLQQKELVPQERTADKKPLSSKESNKSMNVEKDPFDHKKLLNYLSFLEKTNHIEDKETIKKKLKKLSHSKGLKSIDLSHGSSSFIKTNDSLTFIPKELSPPKGVIKLNEISQLDSSSLGLKLTQSNSKTPSNIVAKDDIVDATPINGATISPKLKFAGTRFMKQGTMLRIYRNNHEPFLKVLAQNLNEIYHIFSNEKKVQDVLESLSEKNQAVLGLISAKAHKIANFDTSKLEQRFAMIEVVSESISIPVKLEKIKQGLILVEPSVIKDLQTFNERLEEYIIKKKRDQLKLIEDRLIQTEDNLQNIFLKKKNDMRKKNRLKQYNEAKAIINDRPPIGFYYYTADDPVTVVEGHQQAHGDLKNVKLKNLEHARGLKEVFAAWRQHIAK